MSHKKVDLASYLELIVFLKRVLPSKNTNLLSSLASIYEPLTFAPINGQYQAGWITSKVK